MFAKLTSKNQLARPKAVTAALEATDYSALLFHSGRLPWLRGVRRSGSIRPLVNRETTAELMRVLAHPRFALNAGDRRAGDWRADILAIADLFSASILSSAAFRWCLSCNLGGGGSESLRPAPSSPAAGCRR